MKKRFQKAVDEVLEDFDFVKVHETTEKKVNYGFVLHSF